ncbi:MAG: TAXI family TRAP transporter solute-binding subunit [Spirochaetales bacterium]|nr:TAXI family TRAP transporter solute-binding subunit [Spirochaetales bacterium]
MKKILALLLLVLVVFAVNAEEKLALKSARQTSSYYAFSVGVAKAVMKGAPDINITVESSAGSVANIKASRLRKNYLFTAPPLLIKSAVAGTGSFSEGGYGKVRSLWPLPGLVMHWVVRKDSGVTSLNSLVGKKFIPGGAGSAGAKITMAVFKAMGIDRKVKLLTVDLSEGVKAVKNRMAVGFSTSSTPPSSMVTEIAATTPIRLLSLSDKYYDLVKDKYNRTTIPAGLYKGVDYDVHTVSLAVATYTTSDLSEETAYKITKAFWENRATWEQAHPAMKFINMDDVNFMGAKLHPGALKYYEEIGYKVADSMK